MALTSSVMPMPVRSRLKAHIHRRYLGIGGGHNGVSKRHVGRFNGQIGRLEALHRGH